MSTSSGVKAFGLYVDYLVRFMAMSAPSSKGFLGKASYPLSAFDPITPFLKGELFSDALEASLGDAEPFIYLDTSYADVDRSMDVCILSQIVDEDRSVLTVKSGGDKLGDSYALVRYRTVPVRAIRGRGKFAPLALEQTHGIIDTKHRFTSGRLYYGSTDGGRRWFRIDTGEFQAEDEERQMTVAYGLEFNKQLVWRVCIGFDDNPRLSFSTDPTGAIEVFRLRDIPPGKKRRAALHNWISGHWRKKYDEPNWEVKVRKYLRGALKFDWNGMRCQIIPSLDAISENEELRRAAALAPLSERRRLRRGHSKKSRPKRRSKRR